MSQNISNLKPLIASGWKDYELLGCGDGMKRERWGDVILVRPDPQILWPRDNSKNWDKYDGWYHRSEAGGGRWEFRRPLPESWQISYGTLRFKIHPTNFKHTGLFPEQASNWTWIQEKIRSADRPVSVLNLFGYTGAASVAAAAAGASVCHVDAAKGMVQWCGENATLSGAGDKPIRYIVDDCLKFVQREIRRGRTYDAIMMDPPSYGRGSQGEIWKFDTHLWELLESCGKLLSDKPLYVLVNAYTTGISPTIVATLLREMMRKRGGNTYGGELLIPVSESDFFLPCGLYARWES